jgi:hypothetical protein
MWPQRWKEGRQWSETWQAAARGEGWGRGIEAWRRRRQHPAAAHGRCMARCAAAGPVCGVQPVCMLSMPMLAHVLYRRCEHSVGNLMMGRTAHASMGGRPPRQHRPRHRLMCWLMCLTVAAAAQATAVQAAAAPPPGLAPRRIPGRQGAPPSPTGYTCKHMAGRGMCACRPHARRGNTT